jgi:hypothetical protein
VSKVKVNQFRLHPAARSRKQKRCHLPTRARRRCPPDQFMSRLRSKFDRSYQAQYIACVHAKQKCRCDALDESFPTHRCTPSYPHTRAHMPTHTCAQAMPPDAVMSRLRSKFDRSYKAQYIAGGHAKHAVVTLSTRDFQRTFSHNKPSVRGIRIGSENMALVPTHTRVAPRHCYVPPALQVFLFFF